MTNPYPPKIDSRHAFWVMKDPEGLRLTGFDQNILGEIKPTQMNEVWISSQKDQIKINL